MSIAIAFIRRLICLWFYDIFSILIYENKKNKK